MYSQTEKAIVTYSYAIISDVMQLSLKNHARGSVRTASTASEITFLNRSTLVRRIKIQTRHIIKYIIN